MTNTKDPEFEKHLQKEWEYNYNYNLDHDFFTKFLDLSFFESTSRLSRYPAVIVLSGPSVDNHIKELKKIREKVVLLCCDSVAFRLNDEGIVPDFVINIDPQSSLVDLMTKGIDRTPYLIIPTSGPVCLTSNWEGYMFFFNQDDMDSDRKEFFKKLNRTTRHFTTLMNLYHVGMTAFQVAVVMDLYPVTFLGADFCYTDHWYVQGLEDRRYEGKKIEPQFDDTIGAFKSTKTFRLYRDVLLNHIEDVQRRKKLKFYDSSDGVLHVDSIKLKDFADKFGRDNLDIKEIVKLKRSITSV